MIKTLAGGCAKKARDVKELGYKAKRDRDEYAIENFPSMADKLRPCVTLAYKLRRLLHGRFSKESEMPMKERARANVICAGCLHYDTFLGRRFESRKGFTCRHAGGPSTRCKIYIM